MHFHQGTSTSVGLDINIIVSWVQRNSSFHLLKTKLNKENKRRNANIKIKILKNSLLLKAFSRLVDLF